MFNQYDYNDNIDYCRYVYEKNEELGLNLDSTKEIQFVANNYLDEIYARGISESDEVYENDKILLEVVEKLSKKFRKFKNIKNEYRTENKELMNEEDSKLLNDDIDLPNIEKKFNDKGSHAMSESYDDELIENIKH